jgi:patatin-like phospholipase/acyl hydrolase
MQAPIAGRPMIHANNFSAVFERIKKAEPKRKLRILSIDGGGIRAILPAMILAALEEKLQKQSGNPMARIVDQFDLFAGTSAGGILISLYLTPSKNDPGRPKYSAKEILDLYLRDGCKSFTVKNPDKASARKEKYSTCMLEKKLKETVGEENQLGNLIKPAVITAFNMKTEQPICFKSWETQKAKVWQVCRATSAAPGIFKPAVVAGEADNQPLIDGSIFAGNPAMCAFALAHKTAFSTIPQSSYPTDFPSLQDMLITSIGTGKAPKTEEQKPNMIRFMMKNLMTAGTELVNQQLQQLFFPIGENYFRFNPELPALEGNIDTIDQEYVSALKNIGRQFVKMKGDELMQLAKCIC